MHGSTTGKNPRETVSKKPYEDRFHMRLDQELKERATREAERNNRSLANWIRTLIIQELDRQDKKRG